MMILYLNICILFILFLGLTFIFMMKFLFVDLKLYLELNLLNLFSMKKSLVLFLDFKTFMFMGLVFFISSMVVFYSMEYMYFDNFKTRFLILLFSFVISMILMIVGQNLFTILLGWDWLGLISYVLVIYYNNWDSYSSGMLTLMINRLGDIGLLLSIGMFSMLGSWNFLFYSFFNMLIMFLMMLAFITKSAQLPFCSWLPAAMAAPTPISALVHSSTLVTAGVYLLMRFHEFLLDNLIFKNVIMILGLLTMLMAGLIANFEYDFKKIVALSTLSQLGLMMMSLCFSLKMVTFFHLVIHAMFKSLLFMCVGTIMHFLENHQQDMRGTGSINLSFLITMVYFNCANLALCGYPFLSGFFSKDLILEMSLMGKFSYMVILLFYLSIGLTVSYTFRMLFYMNMLYLNFNSYYSFEETFMMIIPMFVMFISSLISGLLLYNILFSLLIFVYLSMKTKIILLMIILMGMFIGLKILLMNKVLFFKFKIVFYLIFFKKMFGVSFFLNYFKLLLILMKNLYSLMEMGWMNIYSVKFFILFYKVFIFNYFFLNLMNLLFLFLMGFIFVFLNNLN